MKKDKDKSKKGHESTIGKIIYGFLLFLPLFAIGTTCLISTFNQEAKNEVTPIYKYKTNEVNNSNDLIEGRIYKFKIDNAPATNITYCRVTRIINVNANIDYSISMLTDDLTAYITIYQSANGTFYFQLNGNTTIATLDYSRISYPLNFDIVYKSNAINYTYFSESTYNEITDYDTSIVDSTEVFYNSVDKVQQSPLFNWTTNSLLYTGMNEFTTSLSITTPFIPLLLTYWLIISVVYFLYDIVLVILTVLHRKIHNLQDSI